MQCIHFNVSKNEEAIHHHQVYHQVIYSALTTTTQAIGALQYQTLKL